MKDRERRAVRRSERRSRLAERSADAVLAEAEFVGYLERTGYRQSLIDEAKLNADDITAEYEERLAALRRRCRSAAAAALAGIGTAVIVVVAAGHQIARPAAERGRAAGAVIAWATGYWRIVHLPGRLITAALGLLLVLALTRRATGYVLRLGSEPRRCRAALPEQTRPVLRLAISKLANGAETPVLRLTSAPGLSSASDRLHRVKRDELKRIEALVRQLGASAVAVSGPRGAGKSTLLRDFMEHDGSPFDLVVHVEAASSYPARDFTILLYRELCETVIARIRQDRRWWLRTSRPPGRSYRSATAMMRHRAKAERHRLRFLQNVSHEVNGAVDLRGGLTLGRRRTKQLIEQPLSLPDVVRSFRHFAQDVVEWWSASQPDSGHLVIIIDELDRINDGEAAERFINEIKGIFGVPGCTYFVTVSEDALALFERRMIGARPALDSTFDEVLRLEILTLEGSAEMLGRRLGGCPQEFMALCHALSGGLPRELIRAARALIDAVRDAEAEAGDGDDVDYGLAALTARAVAADIRKLKFGFVPRLRGDAPAGSIDNVLMMLADETWPGVTAKEMLAHGTDLIFRPTTDDAAGDRACLQLGVSLWYYATTLETFGRAAEPCHPRLNSIAERLANARSVMPRSTELALRLLIELREELRLDVPGTDRALTAQKSLSMTDDGRRRS